MSGLLYMLFSLRVLKSVWFPHRALHRPASHPQWLHKASDCRGRQHRAARLSRVTWKLGRLTCFTPWGSEVGCRGMNVRNAQECMWGPWRQSKAMRGARAIEWVLSPTTRTPSPSPASLYRLRCRQWLAMFPPEAFLYLRCNFLFIMVYKG